MANLWNKAVTVTDYRPVLGVTLYSAAFSFAGAYRAILVKRQTRGVQAYLLMLTIASILFAPLLAKGELFGQALYGATAPVALMLVVGAFLFGMGMQLGDGCASGTLYTLLAALLGGILMGYGAWLAFGCNIGSFFSGVSSFSLHGWLWIAAALPGTWVGIQLRPWFNLRNR